MLINLAAITAFTLKEEGGYTDDPKDGGNWTSGRVGQGARIGSNMGVGAPRLITVSPHATAATMRHLPLSTYDSIVKQYYWQPMSCDALPSGLDLMVFDYGWNRGTKTAVMALQACVGTHQDGDVGKITLALVSTALPGPLLYKLYEKQMQDYALLSNFGTFGVGWMNRTKRRYQASLSLSARMEAVA